MSEKFNFNKLDFNAPGSQSYKDRLNNFVRELWAKEAARRERACMRAMFTLFPEYAGMQPGLVAELVAPVIRIDQYATVGVTTQGIHGPHEYMVRTDTGKRVEIVYEGDE